MGTTNILDLNNRINELKKGLTASDVAYDNTDSGLSATNVQGAVDEVAATIKKGSFPITVNTDYATLVYNKSRYINSKTVHLLFMIQKKSAWTTQQSVVEWSGNCNEGGTTGIAYGGSGQWSVLDTILYMYLSPDRLTIQPSAEYIAVDIILTF